MIGLLEQMRVGVHGEAPTCMAYLLRDTVRVKPEAENQPRDEAVTERVRRETVNAGLLRCTRERPAANERNA